MRILIVKLSAIGDVVQTLPAVEALKKLFPDSEITWIVEEAASEILEGHPLIDHLIVSRRRAWLNDFKRPLTFVRGFSGVVRFIREVRRTRYDMAVDFQGLLKSGVVMGVARSRRKIGFDRTRECSYLFLNERLPPYDIDKHALERYLDVARYLGAKEISATCTLPIGREREAVARRLKDLVPKDRRLVVVNPMARWKTKLWPERNFAELSDRLIREKNAFVIFTGSAEDRAVNGRILSQMGEGAINWAGENTLGEVAALASLAEVFITTDTGPMHLAAAAGARVVALFGPTAPWRTGPFGSSHVVIRAGTDCSPCFKRKCGRDIACMTGITVEDVLRKAMR